MPAASVAEAGTGVNDDDVRIDKWLWAARFFKSRGLAQEAIDAGRVLVDGERVKLARPARVGARVWVRVGDFERTVIVRSVTDRRGSATLAQAMYEETPESVRKRVEAQARRALYSEPSDAIEGGRPTKRDRRRIGRLHEG